MSQEKFGNEEIRQSIARQVSGQRRWERGDVRPEMGQVIRDRTAIDYIQELGGLQNYFNYLRRLPSRNFLEIGVGRGKAISQLARSSLTEGLDVEVTNLVKNAQLKKNFNPAQIHITSAEVLRGVRDNDYSGIVSLSSLAYSEAPEMVCHNIQRVLVPGGAFKGTFFGPNPYRKILLADKNRRNYINFPQILKELGFDIASYEHTRGEIFVLLAIKQGGQVSAQELLNADRETRQDQAKSIKEELKKFSA